MTACHPGRDKNKLMHASLLCATGFNAASYGYCAISIHAAITGVITSNFVDISRQEFVILIYTH